jgi:dTDP-4-dehydrorhamnose reductase
MLRLARQRDEIVVVADQHGSPTNALDLADGVITVCRNLVEHPDRGELRGVFHMAGAGHTTWAGFAHLIFEQSRRFGGPSGIVRAITTAEYPTAAKRPANSRLDSARVAAVHGISLPSWRSALPACVQRIVEDLAKEDDQ